MRAITDLDVPVLSEPNFLRAARTFPCLYHNLGAILSQRLEQSNRRALRAPTGRVSILLDDGPMRHCLRSCGTKTSLQAVVPLPLVSRAA